MLFVLIGDSEVGYQKTCFNFSVKILTEQQSSCFLIGKHLAIIFNHFP